MPSPANSSNNTSQSNNDDNAVILRNRRNDRFILMIGIARAIAHFHQSNFHRHINTSNIILNENYIPYINEFGIQKETA